MNNSDAEARHDWLDERERWADDHWDHVEREGANDYPEDTPMALDSEAWEEED